MVTDSSRPPRFSFKGSDRELESISHSFSAYIIGESLMKGLSKMLTGGNSQSGATGSSPSTRQGESDKKIQPPASYIVSRFTFSA